MKLLHFYVIFGVQCQFSMFRIHLIILDISWYCLILSDIIWYYLILSDISWFIMIYHDNSMLKSISHYFCPIKHVVRSNPKSCKTLNIQFQRPASSLKVSGHREPTKLDVISSEATSSKRTKIGAYLHSKHLRIIEIQIGRRQLCNIWYLLFKPE